MLKYRIGDTYHRGDKMAKLGPYIREIDIRNVSGSQENLLGVSVSKEFIPSIANTIGTDWKKYKKIRKGQFCYIPDTSRRGDKIGIALLEDYDEALVSQAYTVFETDKRALIPEYLLLWFKREEFDRYARFMSHGSVREIFTWEKFCEIDLPIPSLEKQKEIVKQYYDIKTAIENKEAINNNLLEQAHQIVNNANIADKINLRDVPGLIEISSGVKKYSGYKKYYATGDVEPFRFLKTFELVEYSNRPSRANMTPISNSIWFAKMQFTKKVLFFDVANEQIILSTGFMGIQTNQNNFYYLVNFISTKEFEDQKDKYATGTTQIAINSSALDKIQIPYDDKVTILNQQLEPIYMMIANNESEIAKLNDLQNIIVSKLAQQ